MVLKSISHIARAASLVWLPLISVAWARTTLAQVSPVEGQGGWVTAHMRDDIMASLRDMDVSSSGDRVWANSPKPERIQTAFLEIRTADNGRRMAALPPQNGAQSLFSSIGGYVFSAYQIRAVPSIPAGGYMAAWIINGTRRSNVVRFTIDPFKDLSKVPRVRIVQLEPQAPSELPLILAYVSRAKESDPAPYLTGIAMGALVVDGTALERGVFAYEGPDGPLPVGQTFSYPIAWAGFTASPPDPAKAHTIAVRIPTTGGFRPAATDLQNPPFFESKPEPLNVGTPLADAWDKATVGLAPVAEVHTVLAGQITDDPIPNPRPGAQGETRVFDMTLVSDALACREVSLFNAFDFRNLPDSKYTLTCAPRGKLSQVLTVRNLTLESAGALQKLSLSVAGDVQLSGKIRHLDGTPAANLDVAGTWISADGSQTFDMRTTTDETGAYRLQTPFAAKGQVRYRDGDKEIQVPIDHSTSTSELNFKLAK